MSDLNILLKPFAQSIYAKSITLKRYFLEKKERARFLESISDDIKKCSNFIKPSVSKAAYDASIKYGLNLSTMSWHDMKSLDRKVFHFEHVNTVSSIREMCCASNSIDDILTILMENIRIAWILKEEDKLLTSKGYKSKRPSNAYDLVGIKLI